MKNFGNYIKQERVYSLGLGLREFCQKNNLDPSMWSKLESGLIFKESITDLAFAEILQCIYDPDGDYHLQNVHDLLHLLDCADDPSQTTEKDVAKSLPVFLHTDDINKCVNTLPDLVRQSLTPENYKCRKK